MVPLALSTAALGLVWVHYALFGVVEAADEGTPAHVFQLLLVAQLPFVAFFALRWLPRAPRRALVILALQGIGVLAAVLSVIWLERA